MPLYNYVCEVHGEFSQWDRMKNCDKPHRCPVCGNASSRGISRPRVVSDYQGYECPVSGQWIEGRAAHAENLKRTGCRVLETGEGEGLARARADNERKFEKSLDDTVEQLYESLPSEKKETLANEIASGVDATVTRS